MQNKTEFVLIKKEVEANDVVSLYFKTTDGNKYRFIAGQYVDIKPPSISGHGKSYTISSSPRDEFVRVTVKRKGSVSSAIMDMKIGNKVVFEGPYGIFYPEKAAKDIVMIAAGIGITPFFSIIKDRFESNDKDEITLIYSNKTTNDMTFAKDLSDIKIENPNLKIVHCLTQEKTDSNCIFENSRINGDTIRKYVPEHKNKTYYICGSIGFVRDTWKVLKQIGVLEENIFTESFY